MVGSLNGDIADYAHYIEPPATDFEPQKTWTKKGDGKSWGKDKPWKKGERNDQPRAPRNERPQPELIAPAAEIMPVESAAPLAAIESGSESAEQTRSRSSRRRRRSNDRRDRNTENGNEAQQDLQASEVPVCVIWGAEDAVIPAAHAGAIPSAATHVLEGAGHMVQLEKASEVNSLLLAHFG